MENKVNSKETVDTVEQVSNDFTKKVTYKKGGNKIIVRINPAPTIIKRSSAIKIAVESVFNSEETGIDKYNPQFNEFALNYGIIMAYTDLVLPNDIDQTYSLLVRSSLIRDIKKRIPNREIWNFVDSFYELIDIKKQALIHSEGISGILKKIKDAFDGVGEHLENLDFTQILNNVKDKLPKDFNIEDILKFAGDVNIKK